MASAGANSAVTVAAADYADVRLVTVSGRVDHTNADDFLTDLTGHADAAKTMAGMVVDLSGLEFITSAGLRALFLTNRALTAAEVGLVVTGVSGVVLEVFQISNFDTIFAMADTPAAGLGKISPQAASAHAG